MLSTSQLALLPNNDDSHNEWFHMNLDQNNTTQQSNCLIKKMMVEMNVLKNRFHEQNGSIPLEWLNKSFNAFNIHCRVKFLTNNE